MRLRAIASLAPTRACCAGSSWRSGSAGRRCSSSSASGGLFVAMVALALTHEGGFVFAGVIVASVGLRGLRDAAFLRAAGVFVVVLAAWVGVKMALPPSAYYASIVPAAATNFLDLH